MVLILKGERGILHLFESIDWSGKTTQARSWLRLDQSGYEVLLPRSQATETPAPSVAPASATWSSRPDNPEDAARCADLLFLADISRPRDIEEAVSAGRIVVSDRICRFANGPTTLGSKNCPQW